MEKDGVDIRAVDPYQRQGMQWTSLSQLPFFCILHPDLRLDCIHLYYRMYLEGISKVTWIIHKDKKHYGMAYSQPFPNLSASSPSHVFLHCLAEGRRNVGSWSQCLISTPGTTEILADGPITQYLSPFPYRQTCLPFSSLNDASSKYTQSFCCESSSWCCQRTAENYLSSRTGLLLDSTLTCSCVLH